jgi:hypothetical protein
MRCLVCNKQADKHHVSARGMGGRKTRTRDTHDNLMPLCRQHHVQWHQEGIGKMISKFPVLKLWLEENKRDDILARANRINQSKKER